MLKLKWKGLNLYLNEVCVASVGFYREPGRDGALSYYTEFANDKCNHKTLTIAQKYLARQVEIWYYESIEKEH